MKTKKKPAFAALPPDNRRRKLALARPNGRPALPHLGIVGDTYTILLTGQDTAGRYCLIDMYIPPGGGPPLHRHDFEESFTLLKGKIEVTFRGVKSVLRAGETANIPANAPHQFQNKTKHPVRLLCTCSPAGQDEFFLAVGTPVASRTTRPPKPTDASMAAFGKKSMALAPKYRTEILGKA
jgi:quercetin dioxygenase-like cupin family protein